MSNTLASFDIKHTDVAITTIDTQFRSQPFVGRASTMKNTITPELIEHGVSVRLGPTQLGISKTTQRHAGAGVTPNPRITWIADEERLMSQIRAVWVNAGAVDFDRELAAVRTYGC